MKSMHFGLLAVGLLALSPVAGMALDADCATRSNNNFAKLLECVTPEGVRGHQAAFQAIADANGGTAPRAPRATTPACSTSPAG